MNNSTIKTLKNHLCSILPKELVDGMISKLLSAINCYQTKQYDMCILSSGKFVEFAVRALEYLSSASYTPLSEKLFNFTSRRLEQFAQNSDHEPYRTLIPRALFSMYCIRSKRGGIHVAITEPNRLDATKLIHDMKWVIYEFISSAPRSNSEQVVVALENFSSPLSQIIWDVDGTKRILSEKLSCSEQVLLLLCADSMSIDQLRLAIEYKNATRFKQVVSTLHKRRLINCHEEKCTISPLGYEEAEKIIESIDGRSI